MSIIDRLYAHSMDAADPHAMDDAATAIRKLCEVLAEIEAAALRNNGPLARDRDANTLRSIGLCANAAIKKAIPDELRPPPEHAHHRWHWVQVAPEVHEPWLWEAHREWGRSSRVQADPTQAFMAGYRYLGPAEWKAKVVTQIAAAPELLDALRDLMAVADPDGDATDIWAVTARAAIAKATTP